MRQRSSIRLLNGFLYTIRPWPKDKPRPPRIRWAIYRDGLYVGATETKHEAWRRIYTGRYHPTSPATTGDPYGRRPLNH